MYSSGTGYTTIGITEHTKILSHCFYTLPFSTDLGSAGAELNYKFRVSIIRPTNTEIIDYTMKRE